MRKISIIGTVGVPASYGGFETLAENLVRYHKLDNQQIELSVYCSTFAYRERPERFLTAELRYIPLNANGFQSIPYDILSLLHAVWRGADVVLLLGVSGAVVLPLIRLTTSAHIVTNIDGIEWKREKWRGLAKWFLRFSEKVAVNYSHEIIADNIGISDYIKEIHDKSCHVIAYGGDHAISVEPALVGDCELPNSYAFCLCRIEPENNIHIILEAFSQRPRLPLVFVGNWKGNEYGRQLLDQFSAYENLYLLDPIYDLGKLRTLRSSALVYIHGHSAGGTNPSLVEMMHFGIPIFAFDCVFNRYTTKDKAAFFKDTEELVFHLNRLKFGAFHTMKNDMLAIANEHYTWDKVGEHYFKLLAAST